MHNVANNAYSTLSAQVNIGATSITVAADNFPAAPFYLTIANSLGGSSLGVVEVTAKSGTSFTIVASPATFAVGSFCELRVMAEHIQELESEAVVKPTGNWQRDTMNIRAALASHRPVRFHAGIFYLDVQSQTDKEILLVDSPTKITGAGRDNSIGGHGTQLVYRSSIGSSVDVIRCTNYVTVRNSGLTMRDFAIIPENNTIGVGRNVIRIQTLDPTNPYLGYPDIGPWPYCDFEDLHLAGGSRTFVLNNQFDYPGTPTEPTHDCFYVCMFRKISINGTMYFYGMGDSVKFDQCQIGNMTWGLNPGEWNAGCVNLEIAALVPGANVIKIQDCNMTGASGLMKLTGDRFYVQGNNLEAYGATANAQAMGGCIWLNGNNNGAVGSVAQGSSFIGNHVGNIVNYSGVAGYGACVPLLRASSQYRLFLENNHFCIWGTGYDSTKCVVINNTCDKTVFGAGNMYMHSNADSITSLQDNGTNSKYY